MRGREAARSLTTMTLQGRLKQLPPPLPSPVPLPPSFLPPTLLPY